MLRTKYPIMIYYCESVSVCSPEISEYLDSAGPCWDSLFREAGIKACPCSLPGHTQCRWCGSARIAWQYWESAALPFASMAGNGVRRELGNLQKQRFLHRLPQDDVQYTQASFALHLVYLHAPDTSIKFSGLHTVWDSLCIKFFKKRSKEWGPLYFILISQQCKFN